LTCRFKNSLTATQELSNGKRMGAGDVVDNAEIESAAAGYNNDQQDRHYFDSYYDEDEEYDEDDAIEDYYFSSAAGSLCIITLSC
jgi:hypothetical protein